MSEKEKQNSIEDLFDQIEETIGMLEEEDLSLEESFQKYKLGMELLKQCNEMIDGIEKKVLQIGEDGELHEF